MKHPVIVPTSSSATLNESPVSMPQSSWGLAFKWAVMAYQPKWNYVWPQCQVNVAGLVASTMNIKDADFQKGKLPITKRYSKPSQNP